MSVHPAWKVILASRNISYYDLATISKTSLVLRHIASQVISSRIVNVLSPWFGDSQTPFWSALEEARAVITGAVVLRVLDDPYSEWAPQALDIHIASDWECRAALQAVLADYGFDDWELTSFRRQPRRQAGGRLAWGKKVVLDSAYVHASSSQEHLVRIFTVDRADALASIPYTWTSVFVNAITADYLLCAYPKLTLHKRGFIRPDAWGDVDFPSLDSLAVEGFLNRTWGSNRSDGDAVADNSLYSLAQPRSFDDAGVMSFDLDSSTLCDDPVFGAFADTRSKLVSWQYAPEEGSSSYSLSVMRSGEDSE